MLASVLKYQSTGQGGPVPHVITKTTTCRKIKIIYVKMQDLLKVISLQNQEDPF